MLAHVALGRLLALSAVTFTSTLVATVAEASSGGAQVWAQTGCGSCHTLAAAGASGNVGPNLDQLRPSAAAVAAQVSTGGGGMPPFGHVLSSAQISAVAAYVSSVAGNPAPSAAASGTSGGSQGQGAATSVPATTLTPAAVRSLQLRLARLGYFHGPVTGVYGPLTTAAVRRFEIANGLTADGIWGAASERTLATRLRSGLSPATSEAAANDGLPPPAPWVKRLQVDLSRLGLFRGPETGVYGPLTTAAVERFQSSVGIRIDGRWGPQSQRALMRRLTTTG